MNKKKSEYFFSKTQKLKKKITCKPLVRDNGNSFTLNTLNLDYFLYRIH